MCSSSEARMEKKLVEMKDGERGKIIGIDGCKGPCERDECHGSLGRGRRHGQRNNLQNLGVREGKIVEVQVKQPMGGPIVIKIDNMTLTLGRGMAQKILVEIQE